MFTITNLFQPSALKCTAIFWVLIPFFFSSCSSTSNSLTIIPDSVMFASRANVLRATYQVPNWKDILLDEFSIDVRDENAPTNFLASGKAYIFGNILQEEGNYIAFSIAIRNAKKLRKTIYFYNKDVEFHTIKNFHYIIKNRNILAWSHNTLLLVNARGAQTEEKLMDSFEHLMSRNTNHNLLKKNENFSEVLKKDHDVVMWMDIQKLKEASLLQPLMKNMQVEKNYLHLFTNFDEGRITLNTEFFTNNAILDNYKNLISGNISKKILENAPLRFPAVLISFGVKPEGIRQLMQDMNLTDKVSNILSFVNLSVDQLIEMLEGNFLLMLKDVSNLKKDSTLNDSIKTPLKDKKIISDAVIGVSIKNLTVYDSLMQTLTKSGILEKKENYFSLLNEIYVLQKDSLLYFTKNESVKDDFLKEVKLNNPGILSLAEKNWFLLFADETIAEKNIVGKSLFKEIARSLLKNENLRLESATIRSKSYNEKEQQDNETVILLKNKATNSLLAMMEVLKEVVYQTKLRLDPNYYEENDDGK